MNTTITKTTSAKAPKQRGRKQTTNSIRMSEAIYKMRASGMGLQAIADSYNKQKRRGNKTLSAAAVCARVKKFELQFPQRAAAILGQAPALPQPTAITGTVVAHERKGSVVKEHVRVPIAA